MDKQQVLQALEELQAFRTAAEAEIRSLRQALQQQTSPALKPKARLPDPQKFNGKPYRFRTWLLEIRAKLKIDGDAIGDNEARFYYVYLNLEPQVQALVLPQLHQGDSHGWDPNQILDQLARINENPNQVQEAEDALQNLKQGEFSLPQYVAKFERLLYEAEGQDWPDTNKILAFRSGLNHQIKKALANQLNLPRTYTDFVSTVQQLARRKLSYTAPSQGSSRGAFQEQAQDRMDISKVHPMGKQMATRIPADDQLYTDEDSDDY